MSPNDSKPITEALVRGFPPDRSFDIAFWQAQSSEERFKALWDLVEYAHVRKGGDINELRLQRSVEIIQRGQR